MAANQYGIDLGDLYRTTEAVKGARTQNRLSQLQLDETEREIAERPAKEAATERKNLLTGLRQKAVGGDVSAQQQLLALDPEGGTTFIDAIGKMDERKIKATKRTVEEVGQLSSYVLQGKTEEERARRYALARSGVSQEVQAKMPETFSAQFVELSLAKATSMDKLLANPVTINKGDTGEVWQAGQKIDSYSTGNAEDRASKEKIESIKSSSDTGMEIKSGDESLMYRQAAAYFGGFIDPKTGKISGILKNDIPRAQAISSEATKIFKGGKVTRSEAVELAAKKYGIDPVQQEGVTDPNDPLGLR